MINLLPPEFKSQIDYARRNAKLVRLIIAGCIGLVCIALVTIGGSYVISNAQKNLQSTLDSNTANEAAIKATEDQVDQLNDTIKTISAVLSREVKFSDIIRYMGGTLPQGTILTNLSLGEKLAGTLEIDLAANNYNSVAVFRQNIESYSNDHPDKALFSKADIKNVVCEEPSTESSPVASDTGGIDKAKYPCTGQITATFISKTAAMTETSK